MITLRHALPLIKLSVAHDKRRGESETFLVNILSPDNVGRGGEHSMLLQYVICCCILQSLMSVGSCGVGMQWNASTFQLRSYGMSGCDITGLLTVWLLEKLVYVWSYWH